jgi:putative ABC transport system permease protein
MVPPSSAFRFWLWILPRSFREEFSDEMTAVFLEQRRHASGLGVAALWAETIGAMVSLAVRLRVDQTRQDLRHAVRGLMRQPTFTLTVITTLALALGPATAVFSILQRVVMDPIPGVNVDRMIYAWAASPARNLHEFPWSELNFLDHRERRRGLSALAAFTGTRATFGGEVPQQITGAWVSSDIFGVLGIVPARGRSFDEADMQPGAAPVIILAADFARARFGNREAMGESVMVDGRQTSIIGVLPDGFRFPATADFWQPLAIDRATSSRGSNYLSVIGRLDDVATVENVQSQMNTVAADLEKQYPATNSGYRVDMVPAARQLTRSARRIVSVIGMAAVAIFLLACTNIASLLVVRTAARHAEFSVRAALGASRSRLSRQLLVEHLVLAAVAAIAAIGVSAALLRIVSFTKLVPASQLERLSVGVPEIVFLAGLMTITAAFLGWIVSRRATHAAGLSAGQRTASSTRDVVRVRQLLVSIEVGAAVILLVSAALLLQSAARLVAVDPGFRADKVIAFQIGMPQAAYPDQASRVRFIDAVVDKLSAVPGVELASSAAYAPMTEMRATRRFAVDGRPLPEPGTEPLAIDLPAGPGYAAIVGLRVIDGRWIDDRDRAGSPPVAVISEAFAKQYFPGERAVGHRLRYYNGRPNMPPPPMPEIVGVVSDVRQFAMSERSSAQMYLPQAQRVFSFTSFFVRTTGDPGQVFGLLPAAVRAVDPDRPLEDVRTLADLVSESTSDRRALSGLLVVAAAIALLIAGIGVYGVTAATVAARRRELAIRTAIGADRSALLWLVVRQGFVAAVVGVAIGLAGGVAATNVLTSVLYEVKARDPLTFTAVGVTLLFVCAAATYLPARQALTANTAEALRAE